MSAARKGLERGDWLPRLEAEIARELGQPVRLAAGGEPPGSAGRLGALLVLPGARLLLAAGFDGLAAFLEEARLIEAAQADEATLRELWMGILASVAARLEGRAEEFSAAMDGDICTLRLGGAALPLLLEARPAADPGPDPAAPDAAERSAEQPPAASIAAGSASAGNYDLLLEVELDALVRFGSRELDLKDLLELGPGDVVELDRNVQDPVDLIVGGKIVARGEVVLVNGNFGLRITEVAEPVRRLESIRCMM